MTQVYEGQLGAAGVRLAIVVSRFNELITQQLLRGALDAVARHGGDPHTVEAAWVPGAFEIPIVAQAMAESGRYDAVVCLGALIRGATSHYDVLASSVTGAIQQIALKTGVPCIFGVLTTDSIEQALERAGTKAGNKGYEAAVTAFEMISVLRQVRDPQERGSM